MSYPFLDKFKYYKLEYKHLAKIIYLLQKYEQEPDDAVFENIKQYLTKKIKISYLAGIPDIPKIQKILHEPWLYKTNYVSLPFDDAIIDPMSPYIYQWIYTDSRNYTPSTVRTPYPLQNIIAIRMAPLALPYINDADLVKRYGTVLIQEFSAQSYSTPNRQYHFVANIKYPDNYKNLYTQVGIEFDTTYCNRGYYWFHRPYKTVPSFTVTFGTPIDLYTIPLNTISLYFIPGKQTFFYLGSSLLINTNTFYIKNFTTPTPNLDAAIIAAINSISGIPITLGRGRKVFIVTGMDTSSITDIEQYLFYTSQVSDLLPAPVATVSDGGAFTSIFTVMYTNPIRIRTPVPHGLVDGTVVFITNYGATNLFGTFAPLVFINAMNNVAGYPITVLDPNTFTIPLDGSGSVVDYNLIIAQQNILTLPTTTYYLSTAQFANLSVNPVIQLEIIMLKE